MKHKLRFGLIGVEHGAFVRTVHRLIGMMDGQAELVASTLSRDAVRSRSFVEHLYINPARSYHSYQAMAIVEARMPAEHRLDFVVIVTPNASHFSLASTFLCAGFNVICDRPPAAFSLAETRALERLVAQTKKVFVLTHHCTGNATIREACELVRAGRAGAVRPGTIEYSQGSLSAHLQAARHQPFPRGTASGRAGAGRDGREVGIDPDGFARYVTGRSLRKSVPN